MTTTNLDPIRTRFRFIWPHLDDKGRRLWVASEVKAFGRGGLKAVHELTGMARSAILRGIQEVTGDIPLPDGRLRRVGAGRKSLKTSNDTLINDLKLLVESNTIGDPESPLLWTTKSLRTLAAALQGKGHKIGHVKSYSAEINSPIHPQRKMMVLISRYPAKHT